MKAGIRRKDALCRSKWSASVNNIAAGLRRIWPPTLIGGILPDLKHWCLSLSLMHDKSQ